MSQIIRCRCEKKLKVNVPPSGITVKCPHCGTLLRVKPSVASDPLGSLDDVLGGSNPVLNRPTHPAARSAFTAAKPYPAPHARIYGTPKPSRNSLWIIFGGAALLTLLLTAVGAVIVISKVRRAAQQREFTQTNEAKKQAEIAEVTSRPVTEVEANEVAQRYQAVMKTPGSSMTAESMIRYDLMLEKALSGLEIAEQHKRPFFDGALSSIKRENLSEQFQLKSPTGPTLLRMRSNRGEPTALFRLSLGEQGLTYFELGFGRTADGKAVIDDIYLFAAGEWMSESLRRFAIPIVADMNRSFIEKLSGPESDIVKYSPQMQRVVQLSKTSPQLGLAEFKRLPLSVQAEKSMLIIRIKMAGEVNDELEYTAALEAHRQAFPNDAAQQLLAIDYYCLKGDIAKAVQALRSLDNSVGGDPALLILEAGLHLSSGDTAAAKAACNRALEMDPNYDEARKLQADL